MAEHIGDMFSCYARLWATTEVVVTMMEPDDSTPGSDWLYVWTALLCVTARLPTKLSLGAAMICRLVMYATRAPFLLDAFCELVSNQTSLPPMPVQRLTLPRPRCALPVWSAQTDAVVLAMMFLAPRRAVVPFSAWVVTAQMGVFYFADGFWKMTTAFLDPRVSCAPILPLGLMTHLPERWTPVALVRRIAAIAPYAAIAAELCIGLCLLVPQRAMRRLGVGLCAAQHLLVVLSPSPNQNSVVPITCLTRLCLALAPSWAAAQTEATSLPSTATGAAYRAAAALAAAGVAHLSTSPEADIDWATVYYVMLCFVVGRALIIDLGAAVFLPYGESFSGIPIPRVRLFFNGFAKGVGCMLLSCSVGYVVCFQRQGVVDLGAAAALGSLRLPGGARHLLAPSSTPHGLAAAGVPPDGSSGGALGYGLMDTALRFVLGSDAVSESLGGGLVRVEACTSQYINALYPSEITSELSPRLRAMLASAGHIGRQFNPRASRVSGPAARSGLGRWVAAARNEPFVRYTLPAYELRRVLAEARAANESFSLTYVRLRAGEVAAPGEEAGGPRIVLHESGDGERHCVIWPSAGSSLVADVAQLFETSLHFSLPFGSSPCADDEPAMQPPPVGLASKLLFLSPLPLLPDNEHPPCVD